MKVVYFKTLTIVILLCIAILTLSISISSCKTSEKVSNKSGTLLWAENCQRCHNTPSPSTFTHDEWETIGLHMQSRVLLTQKEKDKIVEFLKQ